MQPDLHAMAEEHLVQAEEAVVLGLHHIERQNRLIEKIRGQGRDVKAAIAFLGTLLDCQKSHTHHRDRLRGDLARLRRK